MKTALWLYLFIFVAMFDLHAQYPILSPFALSLGAAPSFIGYIMGVYSLTHLPGNVIAGFGIDKWGSKIFIVLSLIVAGIILIFQSQITDPWSLLYIRSISGFVLAFLSPACLALLAKLAKDRIHQSKLMAGNGLVHTLASVISPAAGALLVSKVGFTTSFAILGWLLIATGLFAIFGIREHPKSNVAHTIEHNLTPISELRSEASEKRMPWLFFMIPLAISCSQGILFFELPLINTTRSAVLTAGILFSLVSLGALLTLSFVFLNRFSPLYRTVFGSLTLAFIFFGIAIQWPIPLYAALFMIGMTKGVIFPALSTLLAAITPSSKYGRAFALLSIAFSIGSFIGPILAGNLRTVVSSYYLAFVVLMIALIMLPLRKFNSIIVSR
jgi:MFS family permease